MALSAVRTLIVDDHADVRFLIRTIVQDAGPPLEVVGEADGAEAALERLDALAPDVVVMDARMPRIDGFEAAPMLLARRPGLPIVLCTALGRRRRAPARRGRRHPRGAVEGPVRRDPGGGHRPGSSERVARPITLGP